MSQRPDPAGLFVLSRAVPDDVERLQPGAKIIELSRIIANDSVRIIPTPCTGALKHGFSPPIKCSVMIVHAEAVTFRTSERIIFSNLRG